MEQTERAVQFCETMLLYVVILLSCFTLLDMLYHVVMFYVGVLIVRLFCECDI